MAVDYEAIGARIRERRERAGLTQRQLAKKAGCAYSRVGQIERGEGSPPVSMLSKVCEALGLSVALVVHDADDRRALVLTRIGEAVARLPPNDPAITMLDGIALALGRAHTLHGGAQVGGE